MARRKKKTTSGRVAKGQRRVWVDEETEAALIAAMRSDQKHDIPAEKVIAELKRRHGLK